MTGKEFIEKLKNLVETTEDSFLDNMKREGITDMEFCGWIDFWIAWNEMKTTKECQDAYDYEED